MTRPKHNSKFSEHNKERENELIQAWSESIAYSRHKLVWKEKREEGLRALPLVLWRALGDEVPQEGQRVHLRGAGHCLPSAVCCLLSAV
jgi:hypothetical protein